MPGACYWGSCVDRVTCLCSFVAHYWWGSRKGRSGVEQVQRRIGNREGEQFEGWQFWEKAQVSTRTSSMGRRNLEAIE